LPDWVPFGARLYLSHTARGQSLRAVARAQGCHASTVLRQVRKLENRRDDPLVDHALDRLDRAVRMAHRPCSETEHAPMAQTLPIASADGTAPGDSAELMQVLAHLSQCDTQIVIATDMPKAVILRAGPEGRTERVDVVHRSLAEMLALQEWITCRREGRVRSYVITPKGEGALRDYLLEEGDADDAPPALRKPRTGMAETPIAVLARRRDKSGKLFLSLELVHAADRLREDFVMAQLDALPPMPAERLVRNLVERRLPGSNIAPPGTRAARLRVLGALQDLGPGLSDMVLRVCCHLEGVESAEQAMGWCARSGKIVLRIGLQRLRLHYDRLNEDALMIG
jgi:hypothetical protein